MDASIKNKLLSLSDSNLSNQKLSKELNTLASTINKTKRPFKTYQKIIVYSILLLAILGHVYLIFKSKFAGTVLMINLFNMTFVVYKIYSYAKYEPYMNPTGMRKMQNILEQLISRVINQTITSNTTEKNFNNYVKKRSFFNG